MPEEKQMKKKICIEVYSALCSHPNLAQEEIIERAGCKTGDCAHWIWDEGNSKRQGMVVVPLGAERRGHCGKTQHKPFVINATNVETPATRRKP